MGPPGRGESDPLLPPGVTLISQDGNPEVQGILLPGDRPVWADSLHEHCFEVERGQLVISFQLRVVILVLKQPTQLRMRALSSRPCVCLPAGVRLSMPGFHARLGARLRSEAQGADTVLWLALAPAATAQPSGCFFQGDFLSEPQPEGVWRWTLLSPWLRGEGLSPFPLMCWLAFGGRLLGLLFWEGPHLWLCTPGFLHPPSRTQWVL